jgi:hypothetical protein
MAKKEDEKDRTTEISKIELARADHYDKNKQNLKALDNKAHKAGKDHLTEVEQT